MVAVHPSSVTVAARTSRACLPKLPDSVSSVTGSSSTALHQGTPVSISALTGTALMPKRVDDGLVLPPPVLQVLDPASPGSAALTTSLHRDCPRQRRRDSLLDPRRHRHRRQVHANRFSPCAF